MSVSDFALRVYCTRLSRGRYDQLREMERLVPGFIDIDQVHVAIIDVVRERLSLAAGFLAFSEGLAALSAPLDDITARNIVSRSYYVVHHSIRALVQYCEYGDPDDHEKSIRAVCDLTERVPEVRAKLGDAGRLRRDLNRSIDLRHLADYYPLGTQNAQIPAVDFPAEAAPLLAFARAVYNGCRGYVEEQEATRS